MPCNQANVDSRLTIVFVEEPLTPMEPEIRKFDLVRAIRKANPTKASDAIVLAVYAEPIQVRIAPVHHDLENRMERRNASIAADQQTPPDEWADLAQYDAKQVYTQRGCGLGMGHLASIPH